MNTVTVIGGGIAGLAAASSLSRNGHTVTLLEKNSTLGGRARVWEAEGYRFDMGPSWYWMRDIFEDFFSLFGHSPTEFYQLKKLDPAFRIVFQGGENVDIPGEFEEVVALFESLEAGAGARLQQFMQEAHLKYELGVKNLAFQPGLSLREFLEPRLLRNLHRLHLLTRFDRYVKSFFKDPRLQRIMEFPILFLGTLPQTTPALYSFMNYGGIAGGTWYPMGGMNRLVEALHTIAERSGVKVHLNTPVRTLNMNTNSGARVVSDGGEFISDGVIAAADYHHVEQMLLPEKDRHYSPRYWEKRKMAPSSLIYYLGIRKAVPRLLHHTLFFDVDFDAHAETLQTGGQWPKEPLFYVCAPSKTDPTVAPDGCENLFILIPIAAGIEDTEETRRRLFDNVVGRLEQYTGVTLSDSIAVCRSYSLKDFQEDYNSFKGNAYGLANTLMQTALGKPSITTRRNRRLVFAGQLTVPGPGLPPALISGQIAARELERQLSYSSFAS